MTDKKDAGFKYCRSCYDHLAGQTGVRITGAMERNGWIRKYKSGYKVTTKGWQSFLKLDIPEEKPTSSRRPLTRQCIDGTEKKPHLAGLLGAEIFQKMIERKWLKRIPGSREISITPKGKAGINNFLEERVV